MTIFPKLYWAPGKSFFIRRLMFMLQSELATNPIFFLTSLSAPRPLGGYRYDTQQPEGLFLWVGHFQGLSRYNRLPSMVCQVAGDSKGILRHTYLYFLAPGFVVFHQNHPLRGFSRNVWKTLSMPRKFPSQFSGKACTHISCLSFSPTWWVYKEKTENASKDKFLINF